MLITFRNSGWFLGVLIALAFAIPAVADAASLSGTLQLTNGAPIHSRFSVSLVGATSTTKPIGLNGSFAFTNIPAGSFALRVVSPWSYDEPTTVKTFTLQAADVIDTGVLHPPGAWIHGTVTRPNQSEIPTNIFFNIQCKSAYKQMQAFEGSLIASVPPNERCSIEGEGKMEELFAPPGMSYVQTLTTGTADAGLLIAREPNLKGTFTRPDGSPAQGYSLLIKTYNGSSYDGAGTIQGDASGAFAVLLKPGEYFLNTRSITDEDNLHLGSAPPMTKITIPATGAFTLNVKLQVPNVHGYLTDANGKHLTEIGNVRLITEQGDWFEVGFMNTGVANRYIPPGTYRVRSISANHYSSTRTMTIKDEEQNVDFVVGYSKGSFIPSTSPLNIRALLKSTNVKTLSKDTLGLNVHLGLAKDKYDDAFAEYLDASNTKWVREQFLGSYYAKSGSSARFNATISRYRDLGINVVGVLAYHPTQGEKPKDLKAWAKYVRTVVHTYKSYVRVWEIWNEPNFTHLQPPDVAVFAPLFGIAGKIIREEDPGAIILNGGLSWPDANWTKAFLTTTEARKYLDQFAFHVYYCDQFAKYGDNRMLTRDLKKLKAVLDRYKPGKRAWITEMGCSRGTVGVNETLQVKYTTQVVPWLLKQGWIEKIFWFTITDNSFGDPYEDQFGLLKKTFTTNELGRWYKTVLAGNVYTPPKILSTGTLIYGKKRLSPISKEATKVTELQKKIAASYPRTAKKSFAIRTWQRLVNAYIYGGYPVSAIARQIDAPSKTIVHSTKPYSQWKK